jgi:hypothetical protein
MINVHNDPNEPVTPTIPTFIRGRGVERPEEFKGRPQRQG